MMYSPLEVNRQNSQCENGQIMASARDGTPITAQKCAEDKSPISEFDPIGSTAKKPEEIHHVPTKVLDLTPGAILKSNHVEEPPMTVTQVSSPKCKLPSLATLTGKRSTGNLHTLTTQDPCKRMTKQNSVPMGICTKFASTSKPEEIRPALSPAKPEQPP